MFRLFAGLLFAMFLSTPALAQSKGYAPLIAKAKTVTARGLKDPDSAKFRDVGVYKSTTGKGGVSVCGEVNAKNSYGAYIGFRKFLVSDDWVLLEGEESGVNYETLGPALCHERVSSAK